MLEKSSEIEYSLKREIIYKQGGEGRKREIKYLTIMGIFIFHDIEGKNRKEEKKCLK